MAEDRFISQDHAGLLGKRTVQFNASSRYVEQFKDATNRLGVSMNAPAPWTDNFGTLFSHDVFLRASATSEYFYSKYVGIDSSLVYTFSTPDGLDDDDDFIINNVLENGSLGATEPLQAQDRQFVTRTEFRGREQMTHYSFAAGTTIYVSTIHRFRPFAEIGFRHSILEFPVWGGFYPGTTTIKTSDTYHKNESRLLLNPGFEFDLSETLSFRSQLNTNFPNAIDQSVLTAGVTWWPTRNWFLNWNGAVSMDGYESGFGAIVGVRF